jgi:hypothetical protein
LEDLIKRNWDEHVVTPYKKWEAPQLQHYIRAKGREVEKGTEKDKDSLVDQVKSYWTETAESASESYNSVRDWIFDRWASIQHQPCNHISSPSKPVLLQLDRLAAQGLPRQAWHTSSAAS